MIRNPCVTEVDLNFIGIVLSIKDVVKACYRTEKEWSVKFVDEDAILFCIGFGAHVFCALPCKYQCGDYDTYNDRDGEISGNCYSRDQYQHKGVGTWNFSHDTDA